MSTSQPETPSSSLQGVPIAAGVFLVSAAILALQVLQTRVLSVMMWHHHSYMVVTMTLLGFAAAGSLATVWPGLLRGDVARRLAWCGVGFGVAILAGFLVLAQTADGAARLTAEGRYGSLSLFYAYLLVPYFFGGMVINLALSAARSVHKTYFVNLLGSALGAWVFIGTISILGAERLLVGCAAMGPLAALCFLKSAGPAVVTRRVSWASFLLLAGGAATANHWLPVPVASNKAQSDIFDVTPGAVLEHQAWSALCRLDFVRMPDEEREVGGVTEVIPGAINVYQDGDAITVMHSDESFAKLPELALNRLAYWPHQLRNQSEAQAGVEDPHRPEALAIGIGGGIDLRFALSQNARGVLGVEINPVTVDLMRTQFAEFNGGIYSREGVEVVVGEGRSYLRRLDQKFDVIELSGTDTYTAGNAGAYVLSESYLYTREALREYLEHLNPGGTLGMIRLAYDPPRENLRLFAIALEELRAMGVEKPSEHAVVVFKEAPHPETGELIRFSCCVFSLEPFAPETVAFYARGGYVITDGDVNWRLLYAPGHDTQQGAAGEQFTALASAIDAGGEQEFYDAYPYEIEPVSDDSPFFFNFHSWSDLWTEESEGAEGWHDLTGGPIGLRILWTLLQQTTLLTAVLVLAPLLFLKGKGSLRSQGALRQLTYFLGLGAGFMFLEISTIQRLSLFLGHPSYSLTVTLCCFLFFAGLGSLWARRYEARPACALRSIVMLLVVLVVVQAFALEWLTASFLHLPLVGRIGVAVLALAPLNFLMGMPFPIGLARLRSMEPQLVPWALGANGGASVIGSILCIVIAMESGFRTVSLLAAAIYALGALVVTTGSLAPAKSGE